MGSIQVQTGFRNVSLIAMALFLVIFTFAILALLPTLAYASIVLVSLAVALLATLRSNKIPLFWIIVVFSCPIALSFALGLPRIAQAAQGDYFTQADLILTSPVSKVCLGLLLIIAVLSFAKSLLLRAFTGASWAIVVLLVTRWVVGA